MLVVGLTGPTGAGKSSLNETAKKLGFKVIDCDKIARVAVQKGQAGYLALIKAFGEEILNPDGTINRKELAKRAFSSPQGTELLNKTLLPHIVELINGEMDCDKVLLDAPTLFESGVDKMCAATIAVLADRNIRLERIMERDLLESEAAMLRMNAGKPDEFYLENADYTVYNNGQTNEFKNEFTGIIKNILKENNYG